MKNYEPDFKIYLTTNFPEHSNRISKSHSRAWFSRIFFPMAFFLFPALFFIIIGVVVFLLKQPNFPSAPNQDKFSQLSQNIPLKNTLLSILFVGIFTSFFSFLIGLLIGFSRAHFILFEAEKLEISVKKLWFLEKNSTSTNKGDPAYDNAQIPID